MKEIYSYAKFDGFDLNIIRIGGCGLGNLLFPWARFIVKTKELALIPINPTWPQVKIGPIIRMEKDKRWYIDLFERMPDSICGIKKILILNKLPKIAESNILEKPEKPCIVEFRGMEGLFDKIIDTSQIVKDELLKIIKPKHLDSLCKLPKYFIGVHVRLGDFIKAGSVSCVTEGRWNRRIPISWYVGTVEKIRKILQKDIPIYVFSDGTNEELKPLLALSNCNRITFGTSVSDLIALSKSSVMVASGSTYSMWASYLGRMPVIWHKGQLRQHLYSYKDNKEIELAEYDYLPQMNLLNYC